MARIKKRGLDYFPMNTDFIHDRAVRRLMKREGDASLTILLEVLSCIYGGEGYYVPADCLFYEDLSANLYEKSATDVERIILLAVDYGLFDAGLFEKFGILTSVDIQKQYLFSTRRRTVSILENDYCLLETEEQADKQSVPANDAIVSIAESTTEVSQNVTVTTQNVTEMPQNVTSGTHSIAQNSIAQHRIAQHSVAQHSKKYPLFLSPPEKTGEKMDFEEERKEGSFSLNSCGTAAPETGKRPKWVQIVIDAFVSSSYGVPRNYAGLLANLLDYGIPPPEKCAVNRKTNFDAMGSSIRQGIRMGSSNSLITDCISIAI